MVSVEPNDLYADMLELDEQLFKVNQRLLGSAMTSFVHTFDDEEPDNFTGNEENPAPREQRIRSSDLTQAFVQLNTCHTQLDKLKAKQDEITNIATQARECRAVVGDVLQVKNEQEQRKQDASMPLQAQQQAYLDELAARKSKFHAEIQREKDKLEERYAKKTRDTIYRNLVGADWFSSAGGGA
ncbi:hypothetical protein BC940DRAFT_290458 [Gongronella butleri]|nr:hypothetical protein BC940DRAFT_290458 [Gongronella butleri]